MQQEIALSNETPFPADGIIAATIIAALVIGVAVFTLIARPRPFFSPGKTRGASGRKLGFFVAAICALGVLIAPIILSIQGGNIFATVPLLGVRLLQAVVLDNGFVDYITAPPSDGIATLYYVLIGLGYIALPILAALNVYDLLMQHLAKFEIWTLSHFSTQKKNTYVFSDFNLRTYGLAQDALMRDERALIVFSAMSKAERDKWSTELAGLNSNRVHCLEASYCDAITALCSVFRFAKLTCFAISDATAQDISETCRTLELLRGSGERSGCAALIGRDANAKRNLIRLYVTCDSSDDELVLDAANNKGAGLPGCSDSLQVITLNEAAMAALDLLDEHPLYRVLGNPAYGAEGIRPESATTLQVVILGSGRYAEETLKAVLWCGQMHNVSLNVEVADPDAPKLRDRAFIRYPELSKNDYYNLQFTQVEIQSPAFDAECLEKHIGKESLYIICALEDDALSHEMAMHTRLYYLGHGPNRKIDIARAPFIACLIQDEATNSLVASQFDEDIPGYGIVPFGCSRRLFSYGSIINSPLERAGQLASDIYDALYNGIDGSDYSTEHINVESLQKSVDGILAQLKPRSQANVLRPYGIACKRQVIHYSNLALALHSKYKEWALDGLELSRDACILLGQNEHDRWVMFYRTQGFSYMSPDEQEMYSRELTGKNSRHKIEPLRKHVLMCSNDDIWANYLHAKSGFSYSARSTIEDGATAVGICAVNDRGYALDGLRLQLLDWEYNVIDEWTSDAGEHMTPKLPDGEYIVHPASAMKGRECAVDMAFRVDDDLRHAAEGASLVHLRLNGVGPLLVNPVVYDWAFAIAAPRLSLLARDEPGRI